MDDIATEDAGYSIALRVDDHVALGMPRRGMGDNAVINLEPVIHIVYQASLYDRKNTLIEDGTIIFIFAIRYRALGDLILVSAN
jgi:hypothetical protein